jgi:hypothetical protein
MVLGYGADTICKIRTAWIKGKINTKLRSYLPSSGFGVTQDDQFQIFCFGGQYMQQSKRAAADNQDTIRLFQAQFFLGIDTAGQRFSQSTLDYSKTIRQWMHRTMDLPGQWNSKKLGKTTISGEPEDLPGKTLMIISTETIMTLAALQPWRDLNSKTGFEFWSR